MSEAAAKTLADGEDELSKAIEELRGVLKEDDKPSSAPAAARASAPAAAQGGATPANANIIMNIPVELQIVLGAAEMPVSELLALQKGSTVSLNRRIGEPVDVVVNGKKIARGEITVLESDPSRFGVKLTEIITAAKS